MPFKISRRKGLTFFSNKNKLFIEYYMTAVKIVKDAENYDFTHQYLLEFDPTIISKEEKLGDIETQMALVASSFMTKYLEQ